MCFSFYLSCFRFRELLESMTFVNLGKVSAIIFSCTASFSFSLPSLLETFSLTFWSDLNGSLATYLTPSPATLYLVHLLVSNYLAVFLISQAYCCFRTFENIASLAWNTFPDMSKTHSLTWFRSLLKCGLIREAFSDHVFKIITQTPPLLLTLCSNPLPGLCFFITLIKYDTLYI